ncbi:hypothetical protein [Terrabacter sp. 2RAF25]|uniref:hypothetical protein n=1 Tax=Terrabacter sp. 2RAF25 TaxID=3232998 RepID=UPI003F946D56
MATAENPYAGQGPVLLDIGDDVGALVIRMPPETEGLEVEIRPAGTTARDGAAPDHHEVDGHHHQNVPGHHHPHVAVVGRPARGGTAYTLVFPAVEQGDYELVPLPGCLVVMTAAVVGGQVTRATWPSAT